MLSRSNKQIKSLVMWTCIHTRMNFTFKPPEKLPRVRQLNQLQNIKDRDSVEKSPMRH